MMDNWFYVDHITFKGLLSDELGERLTADLIILGFDTPVSFLIGETSDEILAKIQQTFSNYICRKTICNVRCILCSLNPPTYAKLAWFVQRLLIMSPISKPFVKQILLPTQNSTPIQQNKNDSNIKKLNKKIRNSNNRCLQRHYSALIIHTIWFIIMMIFGFLFFEKL